MSSTKITLEVTKTQLGLINEGLVNLGTKTDLTANYIYMLLSSLHQQAHNQQETLMNPNQMPSHDNLTSPEERAVEIPGVDNRHIRALYYQYDRGFITLSEYCDALFTLREAMHANDAAAREARAAWAAYEQIPEFIRKTLESQ